ncbi:TatD family hydrolase [Spirochaetia bacterium]|nr:TatD family hydrolase [Spirochaetia bacterium]
MLTDAHCHPLDLLEHFPGAEDERRNLGVMCAASSTTKEQFFCHEESAQRAKAENAPLVIPCFAIHPQMPASDRWHAVCGTGCSDTLESLAKEGRIGAVGETGFDLYNDEFRATEKLQDEIFAGHLETALKYDLPMVLHVRRAMHKIFAHTVLLKKLPAVIFHSWPGTMGEGEALLRRGVNAYFSFGAVITLNYKETAGPNRSAQCCAGFPAERLLIETDAPYQPLRGMTFSRWADLPVILKAAASLRKEAGSPGADEGELEEIIEGNFRKAFGVQG